MADESIPIDVRQLQPGLYVSLGLRWMDHPFLFNSFLGSLVGEFLVSFVDEGKLDTLLG